jgi:hypothetical protein
VFIPTPRVTQSNRHATGDVVPDLFLWHHLPMTETAKTGYSGATILMTDDPERLALWRAAVLVYRRARAEHPDKAWLCAAASTGAVMQLAPVMGWGEASVIATEAIAAVSVRWPDWMWKGEGEGPGWG